MKIYCFYLHLPEINPKKFSGIAADTIQHTNSYDYSLYAFTPEKESRNYFRKTRNMDIFFEKTINVDREDYDDFCDEHSGYLLEYHQMTTKGIKDNCYDVNIIQLLCTEHEADSILYYSHEKIEDELDKLDIDTLIYGIDNKIIPKNVVKILKENFMLDDVLSMDFPSDEWKFGDSDIDLLSLYCRVYKNTFIKDGE